MKLIDCTISAFGIFKDYHIDFNEDITCIFEENGFGKTTLAAFIKAMFYGLPTARKNQSAEGSERAKYYPWSGGNFGGRLTFEANSKKYRIIRSFDRYSITADTFELIDAKTGLPSGDFDENIGEQLFGVDESGFVRSTFSNGTVSLAGIPASIRNKISAVTENADDMDEFEKANQKLLAAIKAIGGKNGTLELSQRKAQSARSEIERCKREIEEYDRISAQILQLQSDKKALEEQKNELSEKLMLAQGAEAAELKKQNYNRLLEKCEQLKKSTISIEQKYGGVCPDKEKISELEMAVSEYNRYCLLLSAEETKQDSREFKELCSAFEQGLPTDDEMGSIGSQIRAVDLFNNNITQVGEQKEELEKQISALGILNIENIPDETELNEIRSLSFNAPNKISGKPKASGAVLIILSAVLMALGAGVCFVHLIAGIALTAVGAVALIASLLLASVRKMVSAGNGASPEDIRKTEEFLLKFGFSRDADVSAAVDRLKAALRLNEQIADCEQRMQSLKQELADTLAVCWRFMDEYGALRDEAPHKAFETLSRRRDRYLNEVIPARENSDNLDKKIRELEKGISEKFSALGAAAAPENFAQKFEQIKSDAEAFARFAQELSETEREAAECFERDNIEKMSAPENATSVEELSDSIANLEQKLSEILEQIPKLMLEAEKLSQSRMQQNEFEELIEAETEVQHQYSLKLSNLKLTQELLLAAKNELAEKYSAGINSSFAEYSSRFFDAAANDARLGSELELSVERQGVGRTAEFFSSGQQSVMDVCLRLSLIDAMFEKEKPFLLLDDPFNTLDEKNLKSALSLLKQVSNKLQIIYFTCHNSRSI